MRRGCATDVINLRCPFAWFGYRGAAYVNFMRDVEQAQGTAPTVLVRCVGLDGFPNRWHANFNAFGVGWVGGVIFNMMAIIVV